MKSINWSDPLLPCDCIPGEARALNPGDGEFLPRADGSPILVRWSPRQIDRSVFPPTAIFIDLANGEISRQTLPDGYGNTWSKLWGPDAKLYIGLWSPAAIIRYDPTKVEYHNVMLEGWHFADYFHSSSFNPLATANS